MLDHPVFRKKCKRYNFPWNAHELTFSCLGRKAFLSKDRTRRYLVTAIQRARLKHPFDLWAYVIMPEHVHLLIWPTAKDYSVSLVLKSIKQSVGRRAIRYLRTHNPDGLKWVATGQQNEPYSFWLDGGGFDRNAYCAGTILEMFDYIHMNPVRRGLVARPEEWYWSSYRNWYGMTPGPISVDKESFLWAAGQSQRQQQNDTPSNDGTPEGTPPV